MRVSRDGGNVRERHVHRCNEMGAHCEIDAGRVREDEAAPPLLDALAAGLLTSRGYSVERGADIDEVVVRRLGHGDVIVLCAMGPLCLPNATIPQHWVQSFEESLALRAASGIMVAPNGDIQGKRRVDVRVLPHGKFVAYLAHNKDNVAEVEDLLEVLYVLEAVGAGSRGGNCRSEIDSGVTSEELQRVRRALVENDRRISAMRAHVRCLADLLADMRLSENVLAMLAP